ncbi:hypothetical protein HPB50_011855 [Hyalomma asiaticum]|uniref:Uncharacterized protein n=1 Tax=Hyalomma asiaticum TaxID=266040 RepID=A0ACB7SEN7_HYAAI|nr:hypothetical protein HPB50_011855 [Hyalomma asiaticum]
MDSSSSQSSPCYAQDCCWSVPVIAACATFLTSAVDSSRGYLYVLYVDTYGISRGTASWPDNVLVITRNLSGFAVALLQNRLSLFSITMLSLTVSAGGAVVGALSPNIFWTGAAVGGFYGLGFGASLACFSLYSLAYFTEYRATASSSKYVAWSIAGLTWPSLVSSLANNYGLRGTLLLCGACILQSCPLLMLLKYPRPFTGCFRRQSNSRNIGHAEDTKQLENQIETRSLRRPPRCPQEKLVISAGGSARIATSCVSLGTLFRIPDFYVLTFVYVAFDWSQSVFLTTAADYALDKGATLEKAKYILTLIALGNLVGCTALPWAADRIPFSRGPFAVAGLVASLVAFVAASVSSCFEWFATFSTILGVFQGYLMSIRAVLLADYVGAQNVPISYGIAGLILVPLSLCGSTILGAFRDILGSYDNLYLVLGALDILGAVLLFPLVFRNRARRSTYKVNRGPAAT